MRIIIQDVLKISVRENEDKVFVNYGEDRLTYRELNYYTDKLALELKRFGTGKTVGILSKNSIQYLICYFAIIKSGNIVVAINPLNKENDLLKIITDAEIKVLFTNNACFKTLLNLNRNVLERISFYNFDENEKNLELDGLVVRSYEKVLHSKSETDFNTASFHQPQEDDIAQIIYTSGTKGFPNGVCLTHKNLLSNMEQILDSINISKNDNMLVILPFYYSYGNSLILSHLSRGATLTINNNSQLPMFILNDLQEKQCTSIAGVASNFILLLKRSKFRDMSWPYLKYVTFAGEPVADWVIAEMRAMGLDVYVMYGQTEATARLSILKPREHDAKPGSVGRPVKYVDLKIIGPDGEVLPPGEYGQVIVRGPNIMKGYWRDPEMTAEKIRNSYLHTGDFGKIDQDGYLYISGRMDEMIKVGGERVFPIEIEKTLLRHEKVAEAGVIGIKETWEEDSFSDYMGKTIYAFIVPKEGLTEKEIYNFCKENLPRHKVPGKIIFVESLPKTNTGKLKRDLLAEYVK